MWHKNCTSHMPYPFWRDFSFKAVYLGYQLTYDSTIVKLEIVEWEESHQHHICSDFLLSSFHTDIDKYEREETYSSVWYAEHFIV